MIDEYEQKFQRLQTVSEMAVTLYKSYRSSLLAHGYVPTWNQLSASERYAWTAVSNKVMTAVERM